jgi:hypothetical protein
MIKFKAYRESTKAWVYGINTKDYHKPLKQNEFRLSKFWELVENDVLKNPRIYTGYDDCKGHEIYEEIDILRFETDDGEFVTGQLKYTILEENEVWAGYRFHRLNDVTDQFHNKQGMYIGEDDDGELVIIGNTIENPELLKHVV